MPCHEKPTQLSVSFAFRFHWRFLADSVVVDCNRTPFTKNQARTPVVDLIVLHARGNVYHNAGESTIVQQRGQWQHRRRESLISFRNEARLRESKPMFGLYGRIFPHIYVYIHEYHRLFGAPILARGKSIAVLSRHSRERSQRYTCAFSLIRQLPGGTSR